MTGIESVENYAIIWAMKRTICPLFAIVSAYSISVILIVVLNLSGCCNHNDDENKPVVNRKVTVYVEDGTILREWIVPDDAYYFFASSSRVSWYDHETDKKVEIRLADEWTYIVEPFVVDPSTQPSDPNDLNYPFNMTDGDD